MNTNKVISILNVQDSHIVAATMNGDILVWDLHALNHKVQERLSSE